MRVKSVLGNEKEGDRKLSNFINQPELVEKYNQAELCRSIESTLISCKPDLGVTDRSRN